MHRLNNLRRAMSQKKLDAFLITKPENIYYLSNFTGGSDARLLVDAQRSLLFTDARYLEQASLESPAWTIIEEKPPALENLARVCRETGRLGVEAHHISYKFYTQLDELLPSQIFACEDMVEMLRVRKEDSELACMKESARIGDEVFSRLLNNIEPGVSEMHLANQIIYLLREKGCSKESFDTIVLAGKNAALPHGHPGPALLEPGDMLTMDFGGFFRFYAGDMTRTVVIRQASQRLRDLYRWVLEAQQEALAVVRAGVNCRMVDETARAVLRKAGLESYFQHSTGHGLGLEIHEYPSISQRSEAILLENMVVTVEPGIYIPGWGGIRIEDSAIVKTGGCQIITGADKNLLII